MLSWIYEFFDRSVPVILVAQPDQSGEARIKQVLPNWIRTAPFLRNGRGCMHMKVSQRRLTCKYSFVHVQYS
jgi:tyrosyl-DNA phosphodiesterase-1